MISLAQVRELELRVGKVVDALRIQSAENASLRQRVSELEIRSDELGNEISNRMADEEEIEAGLQGVFDMLDRVDVPNDASSETQSENDVKPGVDETDSDAESVKHWNKLGSQAGAENPAPTNNMESMPDEEIHHSDDAESEDADSDDIDDDRLQSEFDIF